MVLSIPFLVFCLTLPAQTPAVQPPPASNWAPANTPQVEPAVAKPTDATPISAEMRGDIFMAKKMYREAVEVYREGPRDSAILENKIGIAYHQMLQLDAARRQYERAVKLNARYAEAINNLGTIYYAKKSFRRAITLYRKALDVTPRSASIYSNLGTAYFARKKYDEAFASYQTALSLDPEVFEHRSSQGVLLQERSVSERAKFHFYLAKTYAKAGNVERTLLYMRKALEEGFKERKKFQEEPEFASLQDNVEFQQLLTMEVRVL